MSDDYRTCIKCKQQYLAPSIAKDAPYICEACWRAIMWEARERITIKIVIDKDKR